MAVDQLESTTLGLIAQMTVFLAKKRYRYATIYVDVASQLTFLYLQVTSTAEETTAGKKAFEAYAARRGISIRTYHANNGIF